MNSGIFAGILSMFLEQVGRRHLKRGTRGVAKKRVDPSLSRCPEPLPVRANIDAVFGQKLQATLRQPAVEANPVVVVGSVVDLGVLREIGQHASVGDANFDLGFERIAGRVLRGRPIRGWSSPSPRAALMATDSV